MKEREEIRKQWVKGGCKEVKIHGGTGRHGVREQGKHGGEGGRHTEAERATSPYSICYCKEKHSTLGDLKAQFLIPPFLYFKVVP